MTADTDLLKTKFFENFFHKVSSVKSSYEEKVESNQHQFFTTFFKN